MSGVDWDARAASIRAGKTARLKMQTAKMIARREQRALAADIAAGRVCGDHERPMPCLECES